VLGEPMGELGYDDDEDEVEKQLEKGHTSVARPILVSSGGRHRRRKVDVLVTEGILLIRRDRACPNRSVKIDAAPRETKQ
jgi:hypothetical protein